MSLISIGMNLLLAGLLVSAMVVGIRLNGRLKALRDSHEGFELAVRELNLAAVRAEQGLADLRAATDEATDLLSDRIEKGRALADRLERSLHAAPASTAVSQARAPLRSASAPAPQPLAQAPSRYEELQPAPQPAREETTEQRLGALLAAARQARARPETLVDAEPRVGRAPLPGRRIAMPEDDLFDDEPLALDRVYGAGR